MTVGTAQLSPVLPEFSPPRGRIPRAAAGAVDENVWVTHSPWPGDQSLTLHLVHHTVTSFLSANAMTSRIGRFRLATNSSQPPEFLCMDTFSATTSVISA